MNLQRLIIVANRLPYQAKEKSGNITITPSNGGLVSSMVSYLEKFRSSKTTEIKKPVWVGTSELPERKHKLIGDFENAGHFDLAPVFIPEPIKNKFYHGFCNDCIWPLFHYFPSYARFIPDYYEAYISANEFFCKKILEVYQPGDTIWIHDYHFMLLPAMIRKAIPDAVIGFFLHIPFPSFEVFRIMPSEWKSEILNGVLGADLVGFHTSDYMQYFLRSVQHVLGYDTTGRKIHLAERVVTTDAFPISIDFNKFHLAANNASVFEEKNAIRKKMSGRQIVMSVDRLDYSKAVINRLEAYELFLEKNKRYRDKVTYILVIVPSREIITKYKDNKQETERLVSSINGKFGNIDWTPVVYQYKSIDFVKLTGLYFAADVALITPLRDGMNLVAKEFVSTRIDKRGVLILSETAGASAELKEALIVNPTDRQEIARALLKAMTMTADEQVSRNESMQARIRNYDVVRWAEDFTSQLFIQKKLQEVMKIKELTPQIEDTILKKYNRSLQRLFLLDYDGTLAPFAQRPELAVPGPHLLEMLSSFSEDPVNDMVLVSGRKRDSLDNWFGHLNICLIAEHGAYIKKPGRSWEQIAQVPVSWKEKVIPVFEFFQARCPGSFIEEKSMSLAWHYRNADKEFGLIRARELVNELSELSSALCFQVLEGSMVVEARAANVNKGVAAAICLQESNYDFILAIGDDRTDEDMFKVIPEEGYSIRVGLTQSHAKYNVRSQAGVIQFLMKFKPALTEV